MCDDAKYAFSQLVELYHPTPQFLPGIHDTAIVKKSAVIDETVTVMPYCVIDEYVHIKEGTVLYPYVYVGKNVQIGKNCEINPGVVKIQLLETMLPFVLMLLLVGKVLDLLLMKKGIIHIFDKLEMLFYMMM